MLYYYLIRIYTFLSKNQRKIPEPVAGVNELNGKD
jgi:hypothetical protein